jgi:subtilisin family serine protease
MATSRRRSVASRGAAQLPGNTNARAEGQSVVARPRLGMVLRFAPKAAGEGVKQLERGGFRVASSSDFRAAAAVPNDLGGADVQYFERFGIAIVRRDGERLAPTLQRAMQMKMVTSARAERQYHAAGQAAGHQRAEAGKFPAGAFGQDYLRGYQDAVNQLVDRMLRDGSQSGARVAAQFDEAVTTWGLQATRVPLSTLSGAGIKVAVLDTGFDEKHPDFQGRLVTKKLFASNSSPDDVHGHGTHCIGTACGPSRPTSVPRYGIASEAEIFAGKVLGDDGFGTDRSIIAGMEWALEQGCQIISMSLSASTNVGDQPNDDYEQIGQVCLDAGTLVVAAASNDSRRPGMIAPVGSPANASTIMAVSAIDRNFEVASFSCGGINPGQEVDIAAPGVDILSSLPGGRYDRWDGTSMAAPHVAGIAALIAQADPKFRGWALWARLGQLVHRLNLPARDAGKGLAQVPPQ